MTRYSDKIEKLHASYVASIKPGASLGMGGDVRTVAEKRTETMRFNKVIAAIEAEGLPVMQTFSTLCTRIGK